MLVPFQILAKDNISLDTTFRSHHIQFNYYSGTIIPHNVPLRPLKKGILKAFELSYSFKDIYNEDWNKRYNYPEIGVSYLFMDIGYPKVLGYSHCFYPYISFPFTKYDNPIRLNLKVALGLSYNTKVYDSISNPLNVAISTPINLYASLGLEVSFKVSNRLNASIGLFGSHLSNGAIKKPNYGLNIATGNIGISYKISSKPYQYKKVIKYDPEKSRCLLIFGGGVKETNEPEAQNMALALFQQNLANPIKLL